LFAEISSALIGKGTLKAAKMFGKALILCQIRVKFDQVVGNRHMSVF